MMTEAIRCPSCAGLNEVTATICAFCNFPLHDGAPAPLPPELSATPTAAPVPTAPTAPAAAPPAGEPAAVPAIDIRRIRPIRPRRPGSRDQALQTQLIVGLGGLAVVITILWVAWQGFQKNNSPPAAVAGATPEQLSAANMARGEIQRDSTNVNAQIALANVLYDTANWPEAIIHYKSALRLEPTRVTTVVDLGVCYYSLSDVTTAEGLFTKALEMDPRQPVALFNLGIVTESRGDSDKALEYFQRALHSNPPPGMTEALNESIKRVTSKAGKPPAGGKAGSSSPGGGF